LAPYGYTDLSSYFIDKQQYLFNNWIPEVYDIDVKDITTNLEYAVRNEKYGIYISHSQGLYAFHGSLDIDYALCEELGIQVAELYH
jgi:Uma2 family endonuclease